MIKIIFFDFDGVLTTDPSGSYTTCKNIQKVVTEIPFEHILQCYRQHHPQLLLGQKTHLDIWKDFCECVGVALEINVLKQVFADTPKNTSVFEICENLKKTYRLGVITDNSKDRFEVLKEAMTLTDIFDYFIVSAEVGSRKDRDNIFKEALRVVHAEAEECVFIDNNESNLVAPKALGFETIFHDHVKNDILCLARNLENLGIALPPSQDVH